jgi:hypothetical protein
MDLFFKMPYKLAKAAKFFQKIGNNVLRDHYEIISMAKKFKFANRTIEDFNTNAEMLELDDCTIFIDSERNFQLGMSLFYLCCLYEDQMVAYDIFTSNFFWGTQYEFFVNHVRCKIVSDTINPKFIDEIRIMQSNIVPMSVQINWFLTGSIDRFLCHDDRFLNFISEVPQKDNFYGRA